MKNLHFTWPDAPIDEHSIALHDEPVGFSQAKITESHTLKLASYATDESDSIVAGIVGYIAFNTLVIEGLWVNTPLRNSGVGSRLLRLFESYARRRRLLRIQVRTTDKKVSEFYRGRGYGMNGDEDGVFSLKKTL